MLCHWLGVSPVSHSLPTPLNTKSSDGGTKVWRMRHDRNGSQSREEGFDEKPKHGQGRPAGLTRVP
jgi:hypothetical protein